MHELEYVIPNDGSTAASKRDSALVYGILYSNITYNTTKTRIQQLSKAKNGRTAWNDIEALFEEKNNSETRIRDLQKFVEKQSYTSNGSGNAEKVAT